MTKKPTIQTKDYMKTRAFLTYLTVAAGLLCTTTFQADAQGFGGGGGGGGGRGGFGGVLTQEQNQQMRTAMQSLQGSDAMSALTNKLAIAQKAALDAALASGATEATVRPKVEAVAAIETDIAMLRYNKAVLPIVPSITADQKTQIDADPGRTYNQLLGAGNAGGRGGRGGRGGGGGGGGGGFGGGGGGAN
jgi:Spy/CpxP family protein refolding chaperone